MSAPPIEWVVKRAILRAQAGTALPVMNDFRDAAGKSPLSLEEFIDEVCEKNEKVREIMKGDPDVGYPGSN